VTSVSDNETASQVRGFAPIGMMEYWNNEFWDNTILG